MLKLLPSLPLAAVLFTLIQSPATAGISPSFGSFGELPQATFGGSGITNEHVAIRTIQDGNATITLGLTAHQRYTGPNLAYDTEGIFLANPGPSSQGSPEGANWNFAYFVSIEGGNANDYRFRLDYSLDATQDGHGSLLPTYLQTQATTVDGTRVIQGSENLSFGFLHTNVPFVVSAPPGSFDNEADGLYGFRLTAYKRSGPFNLTLNEIGESVSIVVNVGDHSAAEPIPEPSTFLAGALGVALLAGGTAIRRRRRA
jgi:MYXO-CTERM domain-containing protein